MFDRVLATAPVLTRARLQSASAPFASAWLAPLPGADPPVWLSGPAFVALLRFRLALPLADRAPTHCGLCGAPGAADLYGAHAVACKGKWSLHNSLRDSLFEIAGAALWRPRREVNVFPTDPGARIDLFFSFGDPASRNVVVADVAVVSPLALANLHAAAASAGGAATKHEATKVLRYGAAARAAGIKLTPLCVDSLGAWGASALALLRRLARDWGREVDIHPARAIPLVMGALSARIAAGVATLLLQGVRAHEPAGLLPPPALAGAPAPRSTRHG